MNEPQEITIQEGSTNVCADLGYADADADAAEMQRKSRLAGEISRSIKARRLTQADAATVLGIDQCERAVRPDSAFAPHLSKRL